MGCDIHMYPERKVKGKWEFAYKYNGDKYWKDGEYLDRGNYFAWDDRNYRLFAALADVRNYDANRIEPISKPRGYPDDVSQDVRREIRSDENNVDHSISWLGLSELLAFDWEKCFPPDRGGPEAIREWLKRLSELDDDPENIRIVFGFDN